MPDKKTPFVVRDEPYKTRDGRDARVICVDMKSSHGSIVALINENAGEEIRTYHPTGHWHENKEKHSADLMPPMRTVYFNLYFNGHAHYHDDKDEAIRAAECCNDSCLHVAIPVEIPDA